MRQAAPVFHLQPVIIALPVIGGQRQVIPFACCRAAHFAPQQIASGRARVA